MTRDRILVTIDGPAGAGKTTVSRALAAHLGYVYVDTGALYRGVAVMVKDSGVDLENENDLARLCDGLDMTFDRSEDGVRLLVNGADVTGRLRRPEISMLASAVSAVPVVRRCLLDVQRRLGRKKGAVFEGRDMGTVVFPEAEAKFFLDASLRQRAVRRYLELQNEPGVTREQVEADMAQRDENDRSRDLAPLKPAADAVIIDSSDKSVDDVVAIMLARVKEVRGK